MDREPSSPRELTREASTPPVHGALFWISAILTVFAIMFVGFVLIAALGADEY